MQPLLLLSLYDYFKLAAARRAGPSDGRPRGSLPKRGPGPPRAPGRRTSKRIGRTTSLRRRAGSFPPAFKGRPFSNDAPGPLQLKSRSRTRRVPPFPPEVTQQQDGPSGAWWQPRESWAALRPLYGARAPGARPPAARTRADSDLAARTPALGVGRSGGGCNARRRSGSPPRAAPTGAGPGRALLGGVRPPGVGRDRVSSFRPLKARRRERPTYPEGFGGGFPGGPLERRGENGPEDRPKFKSAAHALPPPRAARQPGSFSKPAPYWST